MKIHFFTQADNQPPSCGLNIRFFTHADNQPSRTPITKPSSGTGNHKNQYRSFSLADEQFMRDNWQKMTNDEIAAALGRTKVSISSKGNHLGLVKNEQARYMAASKGMQKRKDAYTEAERVYLRDNWQTLTIKEMAAHLGRTTGSVKSQGQKKMGLKKTSESFRNIVRRPNAGQFSKGHLPANTIHGDEPVIRIRSNKSRKPYKWIRTGFRQWQEYHRWLWMQHKGPIPDSHLVVFRNKDQMDVRLDNLELITLEENAIRNSGSINLPDTYVARLMAVRKPELKEELINHPELIDLKRTEIHLKRAIKANDNPKPPKTRRSRKINDR